MAPYSSDSNENSTIAKIKENPMVPIGIAGTIGMIAAGAYNYKNRGTMRTSIYLMHLRVRAQGMVVGAITIGVTYNLLRDYVFNKEDHQKKVEQKYAQPSAR